MHHQQTANPDDSYANINFTLNFHRNNITYVLIPLTYSHASPLLFIRPFQQL